MSKLFDILAAILVAALAFWFLCYGLDVVVY